MPVKEIDNFTHEVESKIVMEAQGVSKWPLVAYLICALFAFGMSTACHWLYVRSEHIDKLVHQLDYMGIAILFLGSSYPYITFKYACGPFIVWRYAFISWISVLTIVCMYATVNDCLNNKYLRAALFSIFFLSCMIPFALLYLWYDPRYTLKP